VRTHDKAAIDALEFSTADESDNSTQLARAFAMETVRERIAQSLGLIGDNTAAPALEGTLRDPDVNVARAAERALARIRIIAASRTTQKTG
jgi:HEAT repeat protein